jgi:ssDNA-binding Zn-finger/Zn-ribbon topoisomerase 1
MANILIVKKCQHCNTAMYIRRVNEEEPTFISCERCVVDITISTTSETEIVIKGKLSSKTIRCASCKKKHLLSSFEEVKDGVSST